MRASNRATGSGHRDEPPPIEVINTKQHLCQCLKENNTINLDVLTFRPARSNFESPLEMFALMELALDTGNSEGGRGGGEMMRRGTWSGNSTDKLIKSPDRLDTTLGTASNLKGLGDVMVGHRHTFPCA